MTKGHFHSVLETAEVYYCLKGHGYMVMEATDGDWTVEELRPGLLGIGVRRQRAPMCPRAERRHEGGEPGAVSLAGRFHSPFKVHRRAGAAD